MVSEKSSWEGEKFPRGVGSSHGEVGSSYLALNSGILRTA